MLTLTRDRRTRRAAAATRKTTTNDPLAPSFAFLYFYLCSSFPGCARVLVNLQLHLIADNVHAPPSPLFCPLVPPLLSDLWVVQRGCKKLVLGIKWLADTVLQYVMPGGDAVARSSSVKRDISKGSPSLQ